MDCSPHETNHILLSNISIRRCSLVLEITFNTARKQPNIISLLEIVSGIKKVTIPSGIKHVYIVKIEVLIYITLSKSPFQVIDMNFFYFRVNLLMC